MKTTKVLLGSLIFFLLGLCSLLISCWPAYYNDDWTVLEEMYTGLEANTPQTAYTISVPEEYVSAASGAITVPESVTILGRAFNSNTLMESVSLPAGITTIGEHAFSSCDSLQSITIPANVTSIGASAFCDCKKLATADVQCAISNLPAETFENCRALSSV